MAESVELDKDPTCTFQYLVSTYTNLAMRLNR